MMTSGGANTRVLAIIPARGGSKGLPRKNLRPLRGTPLIVHTIDHARKAQSVHRVLVSTDDPEIAQVSTAAGADVVIRPPELSTDHAPSESALLHTLSSVPSEEGRTDIVLFLQCTSPLRRPGELDRALEFFHSGGFDSLFTAVRTHPFRWQQRPDGTLDRLDWPVHLRPMRQEREPEFVETGSFYIVKRELLEQTGIRLGGRIGMWELPARYAWDIDTLDDFEIVDALMTLEATRGRTS